MYLYVCFEFEYYRTSQVMKKITFILKNIYIYIYIYIYKIGKSLLIKIGTKLLVIIGDYNFDNLFYVTNLSLCFSIMIILKLKSYFWKEKDFLFFIFYFFFQIQIQRGKNIYIYIYILFQNIRLTQKNIYIIFFFKSLL